MYTKTPPSPAPDLPSKPVTTSPRLVTVSRAVDMANLAEFQEGCRKYVQGLKASKAEDEDKANLGKVYILNYFFFGWLP